VMHPDSGMGVEFARNTDDQRAQIEKFVKAMKARTSSLEFTVLPEGIDDDDVPGASDETASPVEDPLLNLFRRGIELSHKTFREELRTQRRGGSVSQAASAAV
ncbi:MAG: hypothetical protein WAL32_18360, partial [Terriglobales bacterium]